MSRQAASPGLAPAAVIALALALVGGCAVAPEPVTATARFEFGSYEAFLELTDRIRQGEAPDQASWDRMFALPGYAAVIESPREAQLVAELMQACFDPGAEQARQAIREAGGWRPAWLQHLGRYPDKRAELDSFRRQLVDPGRGARLLETALARCRAYLPEDPGPRQDPPEIRFIAFNPDGTADSEAVTIDLLICHDLGMEKLGDLLAHELHHTFASRLRRYRKPAREDPRYFLFHALEQLQLEGIADQIDKREALDAETRPADARSGRYFELMRATPAILRKVDGLIVAFGREEARRGEIAGQIFRLLPFAGHPTGGYMARLIEREAGRPALIRSIGNPFAFVRAFQRAATRSGDPAAPLSGAAMRVLARLEPEVVTSAGSRTQR